MQELGSLFPMPRQSGKITSLRQAKKTLRAGEARYRELFERAGDAIFVSDAQGKIVDVNQRACDSLGYARTELLNMLLWELNPKKWTPEKVRDVIQKLKPGQPQTFESRHQRKDGTRFPVEIRVGNFEMGGRRLNLDLVRDITARRRAEQALREANATLEQRVNERTAELTRALNEIEQLEIENRYLREEVNTALAFEDIVGESPALRNVLQQIEIVAPTEASVLILGETGTGKELLARAIHERCMGRERPLIKVNCSAVPRELFESEFFGHVKGAFIGALKDRMGRFQMADGGTLFLDEIGEIPLELQNKLLRVLQDGQFERIGEDRTRRVDVRILAATNRNLQEEIEACHFRQDLYYRLSVFPITVPPLRERLKDIPLLARHFVDRAYARLNCPQVRITAQQIHLLQRYNWPGNIRELQNVIERAVILARGGVLRLEMVLPVKMIESVHPHSVRAQTAVPSGIIREEKWKERERENILAALKKARGKVYGAGGAAELLGVKATTLAYRMKVLGISKREGA
jgi:PAS domain S-box-containing protein